MNSDGKNLGFPLNGRLTLKIFEYLCYSDYIQLSLTSHSFYNIIKYNQYIYNKETEHAFFKKEIDFFCEFADSEDFLRIRNEKIHKILEEKTEFWKCSFISYKKIRMEWISLFQVKSGETLSSHCFLDFIDNIFNILKEPNLPLLSLKRENVGTYCQTFFQNFLAEILYLGKTNSDFADSQYEWLENMFEKNEIFNKTQRKIFMKARWSMFRKQFLNYFEQDNQSSEAKRKLSSEIFEESENSIYSSPITFPEIKENGSFLIQFYTIFFKTISLYTCVVYEYLKKQNNPYDLLNEYCIKWNIFVSTIIEYENIFKVFTKNMNEAYDQNFCGFPNYPQFSIWRMMSKIWIKNVYFRLEQALTVCFKKILKVIREKNLSFLMKDQTIPNKKEKINDPFDNLPLSLYISFRKRAKRYSSFKKMNFKSTEYENHAFFTRNLENHDSSNICSLLRAYINNLIDLSINEINVHYLGHSQLQFDLPYKTLEKLITTSFIDKFYKENYKIFFDNPSLYQPFLDSDFELIFDIFPHKTKNEILIIKIEAWLDFFKEWCYNEIYSIPSKFKKIAFDYIIDNRTYELLRDIVVNQKNNESEYHLDMNLRISSGSSKMQEIDENEENNEKSHQELSIEEERLLKSQINFIAKSIDERFGKSPIQKFYSDLNLLNELRNTKTEIDIDLEDINKTRDIPFFLEENIQTFYNVGRDFNFAFLEEIYKQHNLGNSEITDLKSENYSLYEGDTSLEGPPNLVRQQSNFVKKSDEEIKFQKFSSFQLKNNGEI